MRPLFRFNKYLMSINHESIDILKEVVLRVEKLAEESADEGQKLFLQSTVNQYKNIIDRLLDNDYEYACSLLLTLDTEQRSFIQTPPLLEFFSSCNVHGW